VKRRCCYLGFIGYDINGCKAFTLAKKLELFLRPDVVVGTHTLGRKNSQLTTLPLTKSSTAGFLYGDTVPLIESLFY